MAQLGSPGLGEDKTGVIATYKHLVLEIQLLQQLRGYVELRNCACAL